MGNARSQSLSIAPDRYSTRVCNGLTIKHHTRLEKFAGDKHSSLLQTFKNLSVKSFIALGLTEGHNHSKSWNWESLLSFCYFESGKEVLLHNLYHNFSMITNLNCKWTAKINQAVAGYAKGKLINACLSQFDIKNTLAY